MLSESEISIAICSNNTVQLWIPLQQNPVRGVYVSGGIYNEISKKVMVFQQKA